jgi:hypothetical protein
MFDHCLSLPTCASAPDKTMASAHAHSPGLFIIPKVTVQLGIHATLLIISAVMIIYDKLRRYTARCCRRYSRIIAHVKGIFPVIMVTFIILAICAKQLPRTCLQFLAGCGVTSQPMYGCPLLVLYCMLTGEHGRLFRLDNTDGCPEGMTAALGCIMMWDAYSIGCRCRNFTPSASCCTRSVRPAKGEIAASALSMRKNAEGFAGCAHDSSLHYYPAHETC